MGNSSQRISVDATSSSDAPIFQNRYTQKEDVNNRNDTGFNNIYDTQATKPEILERVLINAEQKLDHDVTVALKNNGSVNSDIEKRLIDAENNYQANLNKLADYNSIVKAFESLSTDRKIDLLKQALEISATNEQLLAEARAHMQATYATAIAKHELEIACTQEATRLEQKADPSASQAEAVKSETKWPAHITTVNTLAQDALNYKYKPSADQNRQQDATQEKDHVGNFSAITFNYIPSKALPLVLTARVGIGANDDETGHQHLALKLTYVGAGLSVNRNSNVLFAPTGIKVPDVPLDGFGTLSTVLNRAAKESAYSKGQLHHQFNPGTKVTATTDDGDRKIFAAPEVSYQKGGNRTIALTTGGYHWSNLGVSVAIEPVQNFIEKNVLDIKKGTLPQWADANLYNTQELAVVGDHMGASLGSVNLYAAGAEAAINIIKRPTEIVAEKAAEWKLAIDQAIPHTYQEKLNAELAGLPPDQLSIIQARILQSLGVQEKNQQARYDPHQSTEPAFTLAQDSQSHER